MLRFLMSPLYSLYVDAHKASLGATHAKLVFSMLAISSVYQNIL